MEHLSEHELYELAGGVFPVDHREQAALHISSCAACATVFRQALADLDDENVSSAAHGLASETPHWQNDLAERLAAKPVDLHTTVAPFPTRKSPPSWTWMALAALLLIGSAGTFTWHLRHRPDPEAQLFAQAFDAHRTTALRVPGSHDTQLFSPQRGSHELEAAPLLELKLHASEGMQREPNAAHWNLVAGEAALVEGDWAAALNQFALADAKDTQLPGLHSDLGMAYYERATATQSPVDYGVAAEQFSIALAATKSAPAAEILWNRALCFEQLGMRTDALRDLEQAATLEQDPGWKSAIEQKITALKAALPIANAARPYEDRLADAVMQEARTRDPALLRALAKEGVEHRDDWPAAWLAVPATESPGEHELAQAIGLNRAGDAFGAFSHAQQAVRLLKAAGNDRPAQLWATVELAYAAQRSSRAQDCVTAAALAEAQPDIAHAPAVLSYATTEEGICRAELGDLRLGRLLCERSLRLAAGAGLHLQEARARSMLADFSGFEGKSEEGWVLDTRNLLAPGAGPTARQRYQWFFDMTSQAGALGLPNLAALLAADAVTAAREVGNRQNLAYALEVRGEREATTGLAAAANSSFEEADKILATLGTNSATATFRADWAVARAPFPPPTGSSGDVRARLTELEPVILASKNSSIVAPYWVARSTAELAAGRPQLAEASARRANELAQNTVAHLTTVEARHAWRREARPAYEALASALLAENDAPGALAAWQQFRFALPVAAIAPASPTQPGTATLTFVRLRPGYRALLQPGGNAVTVSYAVTGSPEQIETLATQYRTSCADPQSDPAALRALAQILYDRLLSPAHLQAASTLRIAATGPLAELPFAALSAFGDQRLIVSAADGFPSSATSATFSPNTSVELLNAPQMAGNPYGLAAIPVAYNASRAVSSAFPRTHLDESWDAAPGALVQRLGTTDIFHFEGHTARTDDGSIALVLGRGKGSLLDDTTIASSHIGTRLVVLAACESAGDRQDPTDRPGDRGQDRLAQAFLQAGAAQVLASRWPVDSQATARLLAIFYRELAKGKPAAVSLSMAQDEIRRTSAAFAHPYFWAGFSLIST